MHDLKEHGDHEDRHAARRPMRESEPGWSRREKAAGWVGAETEQQSASDRDPVQQDVGDLTDTVRNEPLQPLVSGTDEQPGKHR